jgi:acyl-CoA synthetase (AMP-forming)/AMP-acid ligase II
VSSGCRQNDVRPDDPAFLIYTSGTTGFPKGAMITHEGAVAHSESVANAFQFEDGDHNLVAMPIFHVGGTSYALIGIHQGVQSTSCARQRGVAAPLRPRWLRCPRGSSTAHLRRPAPATSGGSSPDRSGLTPPATGQL